MKIVVSLDPPEMDYPDCPLRSDVNSCCALPRSDINFCPETVDTDAGPYLFKAPATCPLRAGDVTITTTGGE